MLGACATVLLAGQAPLPDGVRVAGLPVREPRPHAPPRTSPGSGRERPG